MNLVDDALEFIGEVAGVVLGGDLAQLSVVPLIRSLSGFDLVAVAGVDDDNA